jgi:hypothetical protein
MGSPHLRAWPFPTPRMQLPVPPQERLDLADEPILHFEASNTTAPLLSGHSGGVVKLPMANTTPRPTSAM